MIFLPQLDTEDSAPGGWLSADRKQTYRHPNGRRMKISRGEWRASPGAAAEKIIQECLVEVNAIDLLLLEVHGWTFSANPVVSAMLIYREALIDGMRMFAAIQIDQTLNRGDCEIEPAIQKTKQLLRLRKQFARTAKKHLVFHPEAEGRIYHNLAEMRKAVLAEENSWMDQADVLIFEDEEDTLISRIFAQQQAGEEAEDNN